MTDGTGLLTPTLALAYLRELSIDVRAAAVLDAAGALLAGEGELVQRARAALAEGEMPCTGTRTVESGTETLVLSRAASGIALAVSVGPRALLNLLVHDVEAVLAMVA